MSDTRRLYEEYSHGTFSRPELASALNVSSTSGPFAQRLSSLRQFGVIEASGSDYKVSESFKTMNSNARGSAAFKAEALRAIQRPDTFRELLEAFPSKLPSQDRLAARLETQRRFNADAAARAAKVLEESLRYAGVLDSSNNIIAVRDADEAPAASDGGGEDGGRSGVEEAALGGTATLRAEIPVGDEDRKVVVHYPRDLSAVDAKKVGAVLAAIVGD